MASKQPIISSQTPDVPVQPTTPETGTSRLRDIAAGTALSVALLTNPAMAQVKDYYQAYMEQCTAQAKVSQESLRRWIEKRAAEGDTAKVEVLTKRLEEYVANSAQKCETTSRELAENQAKIAASEARIAENQAISAAARKETAELRKINEGFQKFNAELPQMNRDLEAVLAGKIIGSKRDEVIRRLEIFVVNANELIRQTRSVPSLQTPENIWLLASFEQSVVRIHSSLRSGTKVAGM
jgi:hypothetical protein